MPRTVWPLRLGRPLVEVVLTDGATGQQLVRHLLADTGGGSMGSPFELLLGARDCVTCGGVPLQSVILGRAYQGANQVYEIRVRIPALGFDQQLPAAAVASPARGFHGIACFPFLNRFTYGNFGDPNQFGLEV